MKKRRLDAEIDFTFTLFGLITTLKEYKLAWLLNGHLDIQLDKTKDIKIDFLKSKNILISNYLFETEHRSFRLLKNKSVDRFEDNLAFLIPELKRFDYLTIVRGFEDTFSNQELKECLASIKEIQYVQSFNVEELKSKENLIF